jgi:EF-P beta-lysylation protein EpmB
MTGDESTAVKVFAQGVDGWRSAVSNSIRDVSELLRFCELEASYPALGNNLDFPLRVTRYFASLIEKGNAKDPLLLQVLTAAEELDDVAGYNRDAVGERPFMPVPGLLHKYHGRVLLTLTGACPIHCRYCFRRHFPYNNSTADYKLGGEVINYLSGNKEIREVILSGGDPLMLSDQKLAELITNLNRVPHIRILRIHSRLLSVLPQRVTESFIVSLEKFNGKIIFVTHINHPNEISEFNRMAFKKLAMSGFKLLNQSVLLKQVNDNSQTLADLSYKLLEADIIPYYLHRLDKVKGAAHFDLPGTDCRRIYRELRSILPGHLLPEMVKEIPGGSAKTRCMELVEDTLGTAGSKEGLVG